jgi:hypothetical protein
MSLLQNNLLSLGIGWNLWINDLCDNMDMIFGAWNVRSLYGAGSLLTVLRELSKCKVDLMGVQEV